MYIDEINNILYDRILYVVIVSLYMFIFSHVLPIYSLIFCHLFNYFHFYFIIYIFFKWKKHKFNL